MKEYTHAYTGSCIHGWTFGVAVDTADQRTGATVSEWISQGDVVERMTIEEASARLRRGISERCPVCCPPETETRP